MNEICWCDGELVALECISVLDKSFGLGLGLFETMASYRGCVIDFDQHMHRLRSALIRLDRPPVHPSDLRSGIHQLLTHYNLLGEFARVRITVADSVTIVVNAAVERKIPAKLMTVPYRRNDTSPLAGLKTTSYGDNILALREVQAAGADEALFLNTRRNVCEGATSNVFMLHNGALVTPSLHSGCLPGVTRAIILELCRAEGIECEERVIEPKELDHAGGLFITNSLRGVQAVDEFNGTELSTSKNEDYLKIETIYEKHKQTQIDQFVERESI